MRRAWPIYLLLLVVLALFGGFAWLTHHPESPWLECAEGWPVVGPWAERFREAWQPPPEPVPAAPSPLASPRRPRPAAELPSTATGPATPEDEPEIVVRQAEPRLYEAHAFDWFRAGTVVREAPEVGAAAVFVLDNPARLALLERQGPWARVRAGSRPGWVLVGPETLLAEPPLGRAPLPVRPVAGQAPEAERLALALGLMPERARTGGDGPARLGPYALHTDLVDPFLLRRLDAVAAAADAAYEKRYGLAPLHPPAEAVVLFAQEPAYRAFQQQEARLSGLATRGHSGYGLFALYGGTASTFDAGDEVAATLIHELVHGINRRAVGPALPPWLDEGLAEDLAFSEIGPAGQIVPERLGGVVRQEGVRYVFHGARGSLRQLSEALEAGTLPGLEELLGLEWEAFVAPQRQGLTYAESGFFVRFLLAAETRAAAFRGFLAGVAAGGEASPERLRRALAADWPELDAAFQSWLREEVARRLPALETSG